MRDNNTLVDYDILERIRGIMKFYKMRDLLGACSAREEVKSVKPPVSLVKARIQGEIRLLCSLEIGLECPAWMADVLLGRDGKVSEAVRLEARVKSYSRRKKMCFECGRSPVRVNPRSGSQL